MFFVGEMHETVQKCLIKHISLWLCRIVGIVIIFLVVIKFLAILNKPPYKFTSFALRHCVKLVFFTFNIHFNRKYSILSQQEIVNNILSLGCLFSKNIKFSLSNQIFCLSLFYFSVSDETSNATTNK